MSEDLLLFDDSTIPADHRSGFVAVIGRPNVGKSTLMNALTQSDIFVEDRLFATLDSTVRHLPHSGQEKILLIDTVGFVRKLPHHLVASFRTTLSETLEADLLIHLVDVSHPHFEEHIQIVNQLLEELDASEKQKPLVFNKVDLLKTTEMLNQLQITYPNAVFISAIRHIGLTQLHSNLVNIVEARFETRELILDINRGASEHLIYPYAEVTKKRYDKNFLYLTVKYDKEFAGRIAAVEEKYK